jgi:hypothetical protein
MYYKRNRYAPKAPLYWSGVVPPAAATQPPPPPPPPECPICLSDISREDLIETSCKHKYHCLCLQRALLNKKTCPMCRADIDIIKNINDLVLWDYKNCNLYAAAAAVNFTSHTEPTYETNFEHIGQQPASALGSLGGRAHESR